MQAIKKVLAALIALAFLYAGPALATSIAIVAGTSTNGAQQPATYATGTSVTLNPTSSIPIGTLLFDAMSNSNGGGATTGFSCTDTQGNTWTSLGFPTAVTAAGVQLMWTVTTHSLSTSDSNTCTEASGPSGGLLGSLAGFSGVDLTTPKDTSATNDGGTSNVSTLTVGPTGALTCPGGGTNCNLAVCAITWQFGAEGTVAISGYTLLSGNTGTDWAIGYKLLSSTTAAQSCTATTTGVGRVAGQLVLFKAAAGGGVPIRPIVMQSTP